MSKTDDQVEVVEKKEESTLDSSIKGLLKIISAIGNNGKIGSMDFLKTSKPYWNLCCDKFHAAYVKARNPEGFRDMFYNFYDKNRDRFVEDVVSDGEINDEWLKNKEVFPAPGASAGSKKKKSADEFGFSLKSIACRGEIIYFDESNEKIRNVSVPITEAYLAACKIYVDGAKSGEYSPLPAQLLFFLYQIMYHVCDTDDQDVMKSNVAALREIVESLTSEEATSSGEGATLEPIKGMMKTLANKFGVNGDASKFLEGDGIQKAISGIFSEEVTGKMKNMWSTFQEKVKIDDSKDIGALISNIGEAIKDPSLQSTLQEGITSIASAVGMPSGAFDLTEAEKAKVAPSAEASNPDGQE
jgi:hypothetical protein